MRVRHSAVPHEALFLLRSRKLDFHFLCDDLIECGLHGEPAVPLAGSSLLENPLLVARGRCWQRSHEATSGLVLHVQMPIRHHAFRLPVMCNQHDAVGSEELHIVSEPLTPLTENRLRDADVNQLAHEKPEVRGEIFRGRLGKHPPDDGLKFRLEPARLTDLQQVATLIRQYHDSFFLAVTKVHLRLHFLKLPADPIRVRMDNNTI